MIPINKSKNINNIPESLKNQRCKNSLLEVIDLTNVNHKDRIKQDIYRASDVYIKLKNLYNNKCAYCETFEPEPEIEHYRPKKQIFGIPRNEHKGYYWLCYEWSNLLPAYHDCNKNGVKGNEFPIEGIRRDTYLLLNNTIDIEANKLESKYLQDEKPLFLNPEFSGFNPFFYFRFDCSGKIIEKQDETTFEYRQANQTIRIVQLNRDKLYLNYRKKKIEELFQEKIKPIIDFLQRKILSENEFKQLYFKILFQIKLNSAPVKEYSFFWAYLFKNFSDFIVHYFKGKQRIPLIKLYNEFILQNQ